MTAQICFGDILVNALALLAVGIVACLLWLFINERLKRRRRRRERERRANEL